MCYHRPYGVFMYIAWILIQYEMNIDDRRRTSYVNYP